ncbi:MAG: 50S ribosomal protein L21 [Candidatus Pacebacteria bacterium]|nr:50S ribosomal protein L21 [Candidatus Paceibacterota bacterium]
MAFAIVKTGGKQYKVAVGEKLKIEKIVPEADGSVIFKEVLLTEDGGKVTVGTPLVDGATVTAKLVQQGRARKVIVFKYHSKARYKKKKGHRQEFTEVEITGIK